MYVRLGFAVASHLDLEILIVDEVLAVGDAAFQKKCLGKMKDVTLSGRTVLFVSHNMAAIRALCSAGVLLEGGCVRQIGDSKTVADSYIESQIESEEGVDSVFCLPDRGPRPGVGGRILEERFGSETATYLKCFEAVRCDRCRLCNSYSRRHCPGFARFRGQRGAAIRFPGPMRSDAYD